MATSYDVASVRGLYPSLGDGWIYLNAHNSAQIPERVAGSVARSFRTAPSVNSKLGAGTTLGSTFLNDARVAIADIVGASPQSVVLGPSLPVLYQQLAYALSPLMRYSSSVVLSAADAPALNSALGRATSDIRWARPDLGTGELPDYQYAELVDGATRLVSLAAAHDLLGTIAPVRRIADMVKDRSRAWLLVDVSAYAPYRYVDIESLGADVIGIDLAPLGGPQIAALAFRDEAMFKRIDAEWLDIPVPPGLAGGVSALADHLARLAPSSGTRREQIIHSMRSLGSHTKNLEDSIRLFLGTQHAVHILGVTGEAAAGASSNRVGRLSFGVSRVPAETVQRRLYDNSLVTALTPKRTMLTEMGAEEIGGTVTLSLSPFNTDDDVYQLARVLTSLA